MLLQGPILLAWINFQRGWMITSVIQYGMKLLIHSQAEVWEWIRNFVPHFTGHVTTYPCWDYISTMVVKGTPDISWNFIRWSITNILIYRAHHVPKSSEWAVFMACYVFHGSWGNIPCKIWQLFCVFLGNINIYNIGHAICAISRKLEA